MAELSEAWILPISFLGGIVPVLVWLWFWHREDSARPEPTLVILIAFLAGMASVPAVLPIQKWALQYFALHSPILILVWATAEEIIKYAAAGLFILWRKTVNEPIDVVVYMITVALGFAALENTLFLMNPIGDGNVIESIITGDLRFLGATLLHTLASATIGITLALAYYKSFWAKQLYGFVGLILAILLHTAFNLLIIHLPDESKQVAFFVVWSGIICLIFVFEKIKGMGRTAIRR
jgi:RsiW-degrading membrane proteinase PrsW (M82 family)